MAWVQFISVKCIQPSCGTSDSALNWTTVAGSVVGAAVGSAVAFAAAVPTAGTSLVLLGFTTIGGATLGAGLARGLLIGGDAVFSGRDDLYIKVNGEKIWPPNSEYSPVGKQQVVTFNRVFNTSKPLKIELMEYDAVSSDDNLGGLEVRPGQTEGWQRYAVISKAHNSYYEIELKVS